MTDGGGYALLATIIQSHHTAVAQRQLNLALTLLAGNLTRHGTVDLVGQPVLASHSLQLQHVLQISLYLVVRIGCILILPHHRLIVHVRLGRVAEHLCHIQVEGAHTVTLLESKMRIARRFAHHIQRCTLTLCNLTHVLNVLLVNQQTHALLTLVGNDFLR